MYVKNNDVIYFHSYGVEHIPKEIIKLVNGSLFITTNVFRIQAYDSRMCGHFCIRFIDFMLGGKKLTDYTSLFSTHGFKKNDSTILSYFKDA